MGSRRACIICRCARRDLPHAALPLRVGVSAAPVAAVEGARSARRPRNNAGSWMRELGEARTSRYPVVQCACTRGERSRPRWSACARRRRARGSRVRRWHSAIVAHPGVATTSMCGRRAYRSTARTLRWSRCSRACATRYARCSRIVRWNGGADGRQRFALTCAQPEDELRGALHGRQERGAHDGRAVGSATRPVGERRSTVCSFEEPPSLIGCPTGGRSGSSRRLRQSRAWYWCGTWRAFSCPLPYMAQQSAIYLARCRGDGLSSAGERAGGNIDQAAGPLRARRYELCDLQYCSSVGPVGVPACAGLSIRGLPRVSGAVPACEHSGSGGRAALLAEQQMRVENDNALAESEGARAWPGGRARLSRAADGPRCAR